MKKKYLVLLFCCLSLVGCSNTSKTKDTVIEVSPSTPIYAEDGKEQYITVDINISDDKKESDTTVSDSEDEVKNTITYDEGYMKEYLSKSCFTSFSQYVNNGQDTVLKYTAEANTSSKIYHIVDASSNVEYWNDFSTLVFYRIEGGKAEQVKDSIVSLNISERELKTCYDLWVALSKNFKLEDGAEGVVSDDYADFTTVSEVEKDDVSGLEYTKLGNKEITHIFSVNDDGTLGVPRSLTVTIYYTVDNKEYTVSTSLNFDQFTVSNLEIPDMSKYTKTDGEDKTEKVDD